MNLRTVLIVSIIISLSSCTLADRFQKKIDQNNEPQVVQEKTPVPPSPPPQSSNDERLKQVILEQQEQLQKLKESQTKDNIALQQLERKFLTNFELLERSVSESLVEIEQKMQKLIVSLNQMQTQTPRQNSINRPSSGGRNTNRQGAPGTSTQLIENYSLFSPNKNSPSDKKKQIPSPQEKQTTNQQLVPIPPPAEGQIINETRPALSSKTEEANQMATGSEKDVNQAFTDPYLKEPEAPYKLKTRPQVRKLYDQGLDAMINHKYQEAVRIFQDMLKQFPDDEYSDNAMFWLGHVHFSQKRFDQAEASFHQVLSQYEHRPTTQGYKTPDAIYMLGKIAESRNDKIRSEYYFKEVMKRFPGSTAASNAEEYLKKLTEKL